MNNDSESEEEKSRIVQRSTWLSGKKNLTCSLYFEPQLNYDFFVNFFILELKFAMLTMYQGGFDSDALKFY